jgi:hypothetical protein
MEDDRNSAAIPVSKVAVSVKNPPPESKPSMQNSPVKKSTEVEDDSKPAAIARAVSFHKQPSAGSASSAVAEYGCAVASLGSSPSFLSFNAVGLQQSILKDGLAAFGIKPAIGGRSAFIDKSSTLKCCLIKGTKKSAIIFCVEANDHMWKNGSWSEKCFFDAVCHNEECWINSINIDGTVLAWFHQNVPQKNLKGYSIRLFIIHMDKELPPKKNILNLGCYICQQLNVAPGNTITTTLQEHNFFWLPDGAVWSDAIGCNAALLQLIKEKGQPCPGYYKLHRGVIHMYFHPQTFSLDLARTLHAPIDQVHFSLHVTLAQPAANSDDSFPDGNPPQDKS